MDAAAGGDLHGYGDGNLQRVEQVAWTPQSGVRGFSAPSAADLKNGGLCYRDSRGGSHGTILVPWVRGFGKAHPGWPGWLPQNPIAERQPDVEAPGAAGP
jgi:hypothetical protein